MEANVQENKMGTMPVKQLIVNMSLPMIISMLVLSLYNFVDGYYVAQYSQTAMQAVTLAMPIQNLMMSVGMGTAVGVNALLSKSLGSRDMKSVNASAVQGVFLVVCSYIAFALLGGFLSETFFAVQTTNAALIAQGKIYLTICTVGSLGAFVQGMFERLLLSTGKTVYVMIVQASGAIINIILDPILIFGKFGFPELGIAGAAVATIIGQWCGMILAILLNHFHNPEVTLNWKGFHPDGKMIKRIYAVGVPSILMMSIGSIMVFSMNQILMRFSDTATTLFGVYFRLQGFVFMPVFGLNSGMVPIIAYNYGARNRERILRAIRFSVTCAVSLMLIGLIIFQVFPAELLGIFNASEEMLEIGIPALRIISTHFLLAGFCIILSSLFQALGNGVFSLIISLARQLGALIPAAIVLAVVWGLQAVWFAFLISELVSFTLSVFFFLRIKKEKIDPLAEPPVPEAA